MLCRNKVDYVTIFSPRFNLGLPRAWHIPKQSCSPVALSDPVNGLIACLEPYPTSRFVIPASEQPGLEPSRFHLANCNAPRRHPEYDVHKLIV